MTKVGRNDPCPCGSGKKYKQCCLAKTEAERHDRFAQHRAEMNREEPSSPRAFQEDDDPFAPDALEDDDFSEDEYFGEDMEDEEFSEDDENEMETSAWWRVFEEADYEDQFRLFLDALDDPEVLDDELAFDALSMIYEDTAERHERHRFDALMTALQTRRPELYEESALFYLDWGIANALISGNSEAAAAMALALAGRAEEDVEVLSWMLDRLAYYGQLAAMLKTLHAAWPTLKGSNIIDPDTIDELKDLATNCVIFDYLERCPEPDAQDPALVNGLRYYSEAPDEHLGGYFEALSGKIRNCWALDDFTHDDARKRGPQMDRDDLFRIQVFHLCTEFLRYLRTEKGVPYTKGHLACMQWLFYLLERYDGALELGRASYGAAPQRSKKKSKKKSRPQLEHPLCPDAATFEIFLEGLLDEFEPHYLSAATTFELLPAWLDFLAAIGLLDPQQQQRTLTAIYPLRELVIEALTLTSEDPAIEENIERAWKAVKV